MKFKKSLLIICLIICIFAVASVSATDVNDTAIASEDTDQMELSTDDGITEDNLQANNEETVSAETDSEILTDGQYTYSNLREQIGSGGNINLTKGTYTYNNDGDTIVISTSGVINGNGAVIDMAGSNIQAFEVLVSDVTIKNLTIKNINTKSKFGGAIYFESSGTVTNCNFNNNNVTQGCGGAIYFKGEGTVTNCSFNNNNVTQGGGGAIYFESSGTVTNCSFNNNNVTQGRGGAIYFESSGTVTNCNFTNNQATGTNSNGGAVYFYGYGTVTNCTFTGNTASDDGGAVYFVDTGTVTNCNFADNTAASGGAVYFNMYGTGTVTNCNFTGNTANNNGGAVCFVNDGEVTNCNFTDNSVTVNGGAVCFVNDGEVTNCNFTNNKATGDYARGGAIFFLNTATVTNCNFVDNTANYEGGAIFSGQRYTTADTCIFKRNSGDNVNTVIYPPTLNVNNFTTVYGSGDKLTFDLKTNSSIPVTNGNISISVYFKDNGVWVRNYTCLSGEGWIPDLPVGSYIAFFDTEYAKFQKINRTVTITLPNVRYSINVTSLTTNNKTVNITAKTDIPKDILWDGKLLFILPNGTEINATYGTNGTWWAVHKFDDYDVYQVNATYQGLDNVTVNNATITVNKIKTELSGNAITTTYNINKDLIITLKDSNGNPVSGAKLIVDLNGAKTYTTDSNGQVKVSTKGLAPKAYTAKITFNGDDKYINSTKDVKVTVKKATPKLTAKKKTFKTSVKTKKYTITLKDNTGKAIKKAKVTLKVKGKTYKATTNSKGKAVFKIKNLKKKGTFKATVTYKGNKYYNKVTKKAKIKVIVTFKTVSKGSKDKATVKEIQQALKNNGYYLTYDGHYLKIDGIYHGCTERSVREFQHDKGLKVTGKVDEKTAKKLGII